MRARAYVYAQTTYHNWHKKDNLYPVGHLSLLSPDEILKVAKFQDVRTERNKRLLICLERLLRGQKADIIPPTCPSVNHFGCKSSEKFADEQIFRLKVYSLRFKGKKIPQGDWGLINKEVQSVVAENGQRDVRKNTNEMHKVKCFSNGVNLFRK